MYIPAFACLCLLMCARLTYIFTRKIPAHTVTRAHLHCLTREGTALAARVRLTVSSLLPTDAFILTTTASSRRCQPTYFPGFRRLSECICVTWLLTQSRARVTERVYIICTSMEMQNANQHIFEPITMPSGIFSGLSALRPAYTQRPVIQYQQDALNTF